jgi:hypothetical protein
MDQRQTMHDGAATLRLLADAFDVVTVNWNRVTVTVVFSTRPFLEVGRKCIERQFCALGVLCASRLIRRLPYACDCTTGMLQRCFILPD